MDPAANPDFWWQNVTAVRNPQQEEAFYGRGRGVGGTSAVNAMYAIRGVPEDYDRWAEAGAEGWSFAEVLPYFRKLEDDPDHGDQPYHGTGGPIPIFREPQDGWGAVDLAFAEAVRDMGYAWADDHNAPGSTGLSPFAVNMRDGRRVSTNDAYLEPSRGRTTLTIRGGAQAGTLIIDPARQRAVGVRLVGGEELRVRAGGEVIVCCGAVHSPALLLRSGIGPAAELAALGIDTVSDLPVGRGVQDHGMLIVPIRSRGDLPPARGGRVSNCILRYASGLAGTGENDMFMVPNNGFRVRGGPGLLVAQQEQVFSRGRLTLRSRDPLDEPYLEQGVLTDPRDLSRMRDSLTLMAEIAGHKAFQAILDGPFEPPDPGEVMRIVVDNRHLTSTCRMGSPDDPASVLDPDCRVLGIAGLRVVDASIFPDTPRANPHLTIVMAAEHVADRIRTTEGS
jgi:choline dehydrogenase-like flavoprotein